MGGRREEGKVVCRKESGHNTYMYVQCVKVHVVKYAHGGILYAVCTCTYINNRVYRALQRKRKEGEMKRK